MSCKDRLPKVIAFTCSVAVGVGAFAGLTAWGFSLLGPIEQQIVASSVNANGSLFIRTTQTGDGHAKP